MRRRVASAHPLGALLWSILLLTGCAACPPVLDPPPQAALPPLRAAPAFPPQQVMEGSDYARFLAENRQLLERCDSGAGCDVALFNVGFVYAYPQSPYYDPQKALPYFDDLIKKYPQTPWAFAGRAWRELLVANLGAEEKRRRLQADLRSKDATIRTLRTQLGRARDIDIELDKKERELLR